MFDRVKAKIHTAREAKERRLEQQRIDRLQEIKTQEVYLQNYRREMEKQRVFTEATASLRASVDTSDIDGIIRIVRQFGHDPDVMNTLFHDPDGLWKQQSGYSRAVDTLLIRAMKHGNLVAVRALMQDDAINPDQGQAWEYVTNDHPLWRSNGCILHSDFTPEYDPNHHKIVLLTAKQYAAMFFPEALPLLSRTNDIASTHTAVNTALPEPECTDRNSLSEFLLWKKQRQEAQQVDTPVCTTVNSR